MFLPTVPLQLRRCAMPLLAIACSASNTSGAGSALPDSSSGAAARPPGTEAMPMTPSTGIHLRVRVPSEAVAGTRIPITLVLVNSGDRAAELYLRGRTIAFDTTIEDAAGIVIW